MSRLTIIYVVLISLCFTTIISVSAESEAAKGEEKLQKLLAESRRSPLRSLDASDFEYFVQDAPRPYSLVVLLTQGGGGCKMCNDLQPEVALVARALENARYDNGSNNKTARHNLFFLRLDAARNFELFKKIGLQTIPHLYYVPPVSGQKKIKWGKVLSDKLNFYQGFGADQLLRLIQARTHFEFSVTIERPPEAVDWTPALLTIITVGGLLYFALTIGRPLVDKYLRNSYLYLLASLAMYAYCASGSMYNIIRETPWMQQNGKEIMYIYPGSHNQFGAESFIVGLLYTMCAFAVIMLNSRALTSKSNSFNRNVLVAIFAALFYIFFRLLRSVYTRKNGSYNMGFVWDGRTVMWD